MALEPVLHRQSARINGAAVNVSLDRGKYQQFSVAVQSTLA